MKLTLWRLLMMYSFTYSQVMADDQVILSNVTNGSDWFGWREANSLAGAYWTLCNDAILLNTTQSGNETVEQYSLFSPLYMMSNNCNVSISYTRQAEITVEVIAIFGDDDNITITNLNGTIDEVQVVALPVNISQPIAQIILSVTTNLNEELLTIDSISFSDRSDFVSPTPSVESSLAILTKSTELLQTSSISTGIFTSPDGSGMLSSSSSQFNEPVSSISLPTTMTVLLPTFTTTTVNNSTPDVTSLLSVLSTTTMSSSIDIATSSLLESTSSPVNMSTVARTTSTASVILSTTTLSPISTTSNIVTSSSVTSSSITSSSITSSSITSSSITSSSITSMLISVSLTSATASVTMVSVQSLNMTETPSSSLSSSTVVVVQLTSVQSVNSTSLMMPSVIVSTTDMSLSSTTMMPSSSNASESSSDTNFFSTNVIIGIAAGGGTLLLILLCFLVCCLYRICCGQRNQQQKYLISDTGYKNSHKGHSSVFAQERYRHKSRSVESMNGPCQYELPFVPSETAPEAYVHSINSEDIQRDLRGTPTSSQSAAVDNHDTVMASFYPHTADHHHWSDYSSDNNDDEMSSDIVYPNKNLDDMCSGELPPILSLGDYEDDENVVIVNPYNYPTFYSESSHIPNKDASPRRSGTTKSNINLEALTTLESSGEYTPKPTVPNYRRKQSRYAAGKNHKLLRKTKSELNLEDATKIAGGTTYPSKSRIDLKEATKLASHSSGVARVNHHHRKPHHSSTPRILDSSSRLERLTSLDTY